MVLALAIVVHTILIFVYYLRTKIYYRLCTPKDILPTSHSNVAGLERHQSANSISMVFGHENKAYTSDRNQSGK